MTLRIKLEDLGAEVRECLERGEAVEIERDGEVVGRLEPKPPRRPTLVGIIKRLRTLPPVDEDFAADLAKIREEANKSPHIRPWE